MTDVLHACTIVARNYLAQAQVLAETFHEHHPDGTFDILLVDDPDTDRPEVPRANVVMVDELDIPRHHLDEMTVSYALIELATALKPWFLLTLLGRGYDHATYFDPDITIMRRIGELPGLARDHSVVLTPHLTEPMPRDGKQPSEQHILISGANNLGFISVGNTAEGRRMLEWWGERLVTDSFVDHTRGFFTDQKPVDLVPGIFEHVLVKDPSWNFAYWNAATRPLTRDDDDNLLIGGHPATFIHFSGYSPAVPHLFSKHQGINPRTLLSEHPQIRELCDAYGRRLVEAGFLTRQEDFTAPFTEMDGITLTRLVRDLIRTELRERRVMPARRGAALALGLPPGEAESALPLADWLMSPDPYRPLGGLGRLLSGVYHRRTDVRAAFPEAASGKVNRFLAWVDRYGVREEGIPVGFADRERARLAVSTRSTHLLQHPGPDRGRMVHGVEVAGYLTAELGLGEAGRQFVGSIQAAGIPVSTSTYTRTSSRLDAEWTDIAAPEGNRHDVLLSCVNGDQLPHLVNDAGPHYFKRRYHIGLWYWELTELPEGILRSLDLVDEVWVSSDYIGDALKAVTDKPVTVLPGPTHAPRKSDVRIPEIADSDRFTFLFVFDQFSIMERKNPLGVIEAFKRAFPEPGRAQLVIKSINGHVRVVQQEQLRYATLGRPDITLVERYLSRAELDGLMWNSDCYVSLHRSEGFGQTLSEMMAIGKPVIGTGYSGNLSFMDSGISHLVDHTLVSVPPGCEPYPTTSSWADPDLDQAAAHMRAVVDDPVAAAAMGERAAAHIAAHHSLEAVGDAVRTRLEEIWAERDAQAARRRARRARREAMKAAEEAEAAAAAARPTARLKRWVRTQVTPRS